ncbi:MAG: hypothetical protein ACE5E7_14245 [Anaerolineae bacterium]
MSDLDAALAALRSTPQDEVERAVAARYAPLICMDVREPFRPLVAGYTLFRADGPSPSFSRHIQLAPDETLVVEYAIWWDWDLHHLYELEHIWVYVDGDGRPVRVEGSWHGEVKDLREDGRIPLREEHPVVFASPGKHAFAPSVRHFQAQHEKTPGITSRYVGGGGITLNGRFDEKIKRTPMTDRLVHTYLARFAFTPSWDYSAEWLLGPAKLVPWSALQAWIPDRINAWLDVLKETITAEEYRYLRAAVCTSRQQILRAGELHMDMVQLGVGRHALGFPVLTDSRGQRVRTQLLTALYACVKARVGAYLIIHDVRLVPLLRHLLGHRDWSDYLMTGSDRPEWLAAIKEALPRYRTALIMAAPTADIVAAAQAAQASYVHVNAPLQAWPGSEWVQEVRRADLGVMCGPVTDAAAVSALAAVGVEAIIATDPAYYPPLNNAHLCLSFPR